MLRFTKGTKNNPFFNFAAAEFILHLHDQANGSYEKFKKSLDEVGADFPASLIESLNRVINTMKPKKGQNHSEDNAPLSADEKVRRFPGLAMADDPEWEKKRQEDAAVAEDLMSQLEDLNRNGSERKRSRSRSPNRSERSGYDKKRHRSRSRSPRRRRSRSRSPQRGRSPSRRDREFKRPIMDVDPVIYKIYDGKITNIKPFGAFVQLEGIQGRREGLVHIGMLASGGRVNDASEVVQRGQRVKVKVMSVAGTRISLSLRDVDQRTGQDLSPHLRVRSETEIAEETTRNPDRPAERRARIVEDKETGRSRKRLSSPERWEIKQLIASGVLDPSEYPDYDDENGLLNDAETEEDMDVEIREEEPPFLQGQTKQTLQLSPVKVVKVPDGSMNRAAMEGAALSKERRELRQQQMNEEQDAVPRDLNQSWQDPMPEPGGRQFAQDMRGAAMSTKSQQSEWKKATFNAATSFGRITSLSIQEQRESLPIYKLRGSLVQAIAEVCLERHI
jgi:ATP-dependent RNA helicase DHX8/PRP22